MKQLDEPLNLEKLQSGDRDEFTRMVTTYSDAIYRIGLKMTGQADDAEDVLQETFIKAFKSLKSFQGKSQLSTWLYRIALNEALMLLRKRKPESPIFTADEETDSAIGLPVENIVDWCYLPEETLLTQETRQKLDDGIKNLPENLRTVFILRDLEDLSTAETAQTLNLTENNVKTRLLRARLKIREELSIYFRERVTR
jgi:RNA polymerase sigma-70 factor (ECF subfamily)